MCSAGWDAVAPSLVVIGMEAVATLNLDHFLAVVARADPVLARLDGSVNSFEALYSAHHRDVSRHVILVTRDRDDVEEIVDRRPRVDAVRTGPAEQPHHSARVDANARCRVRRLAMRPRFVEQVARPAGLEPTAFCSGGRRSIR